MTIFGGGQTTQPEATTTQHETALNVQSSSAGKVVAVVLGTKRVAGNLVWYGDFQAIAHTSSSGGGGGGGKGGGGGGGGTTTTSYTYKTSTMVGLCVGPIQGIGTVWVSDDKKALADLGSSVNVATGAHGQPVWPWLASAHPDQALAYSGLAYVGIAAADLGTSSSLPAWNWEVRGLGTPVATDAGGAYDISPAEAIRLVVEDTAWGCGQVGMMADLTDYTAWCAAHGIVISDAYTDARSGREIIQDYTKATLSEAVWSGDHLKIVPYADQPVGDYVPDLTPVLIVDATMLLPAASDDETPIKVKRKDQSDLANYLTVEYHDRSDDYNVNTVTATDDGHKATYGQRPGNSIAAHFLHTAAIAQHVADMVQARDLSVTAGYEFGLGPVGAIVEPMDILWIGEPGQGFVNFPVRVKEITEEDAFSFRVTAEDVPGIVGAMASRPVAVRSGYRSGYNIPPAALCNPPVIFEAPYELTTAAGRLEVWVAISSADPNWGGCEVWLSLDGDTFKRAGAVNGKARTGVLSADLAATADPDTASTLAVDLSESGATLLSGTKTDADLYVTLCWVDGEMLSYRDADLTGPGRYDLAYLRRGAYRSTVSVHAAGARFARLDDAIFKLPFTADMIGTTIHLKVLGFNQRGGGLQDIADVPAYAYQITGRDPPPTPINLFRRDGRAYWEIPDPPADLAGSRIRHLAGRTRNWQQGMDWPTDGAVVTARELDLAQFGSGERTIMVRSVDTSGNLSTGTAYLTVGLGEPAVANAVWTYDDAAAGFAGTVADGSVVDGHLVAADTGEAYLPADAPLYLPNIDDPYLPVSYQRMVYDLPPIVPPADFTPGSMTIAATISGEGWQILLRHHDGGLYLPDDAAAYLPDDAAAYLGGVSAWTPWPGSMTCTRQPYYVRIVTEAGVNQGVVSALAAVVDVPDIVESFEDLFIPAGGGRIPITRTYRAIDYVGTITLQDTGTGAVSVLVVDRDPIRGPLLRAVNSAGADTAAVIDIHNLKGH
ncbi:phage tail protein [Phaeospirillum tilakii]|uniref:Phage tail protein n=1 Tax=Phaeospirillum tilakii TaxID=741673 RepID=A0ABW5CC68_9PROT